MSSEAVTLAARTRNKLRRKECGCAGALLSLWRRPTCNDGPVAELNGPPRKASPEEKKRKTRSVASPNRPLALRNVAVAFLCVCVQSRQRQPQSSRAVRVGAAIHFDRPPLVFLENQIWADAPG